VSSEHIEVVEVECKLEKERVLFSRTVSSSSRTEGGIENIYIIARPLARIHRIRLSSKQIKESFLLVFKDNFQ
jgi:hypothetical protein